MPVSQPAEQAQQVEPAKIVANVEETAPKEAYQHKNPTEELLQGQMIANKIGQQPSTVLLRPIEPAMPHPSTTHFQETTLKILSEITSRISKIEA